MSFSLTSRLNRAAKRLAPLEPRRIVRALRHHHARTRALANRAITPAAPRLGGLRSWLPHASARRLGLPALLRKPSSLRLLTLRRANGPRRRVNRPRRLSASAGWFAFGAR
ncbi:hypothetical protein [Burkholderia gladioli]|uniref:hypothetical protein n=1 Tax=Burkholderia gladioli TaxID=28095 RepID=UPI0006271E39|nr:hypothetical protein [Burkholderia gladioli]KKJ08750.1 hypothetical protein XF14_04760 [Burkholderia gladioli]